MAYTRLAKTVISLCIFSFFFQLLAAQTCADPTGNIVVSNTDDDGPGSLRAAMNCANVTAGANTISFDITTPAPHIIYVGSTSGLPLPDLIEPATMIDARTQSGYTGTPIVVLDGAETNWGNPVNAITLATDFCAVYGFEIKNFPDDGIELKAADFSIVRDNYIHNNGYPIDFFPNVPGTGPWEGSGIVLRGNSNSNIIAGNRTENNEYCGIIVQDSSTNNLIGGPNPEDANHIQSNAAGVLIENDAAGIQLQQNSIFCNDTIGIKLVGAANNNQDAPVIEQIFNNQISGTADDGALVELFVSNNANCTGAVCQGNLWIGSTTSVNGQWSFNPNLQSVVPVFGGYVITATATDAAGNTSEFSSCEVIIGTSGCTRPDGTIRVTNTNDSGPGSLRQAIHCANSTLGGNTIVFDILDSSPTLKIYVGEDDNTPLPALLDPATIIDGSTQAAYGANGNDQPKIILDGSKANWNSPINALWIRSDYCEVYALEITNFPDDGIDVTFADYVRIGALDKPNVIYNNGDPIDDWPDAPENSLANAAGIVLQLGSDFCEISGNYIGTDYRQELRSGNEQYGVLIKNGGDRHVVRNNIIAHHPQGITLENGSTRNTLSRNNLYCNDSIPLDFLGNANLNISAPLVDSASNFYISGRADSLDIVEVFIQQDSACINTPCQGSIYLGTAIVSDSTWSLAAPFPSGIELRFGDRITTTATDVQGNTSKYSPCRLIDIVCTMELSISGLSSTSCGINNGAFTVSIQNGTPPYALDIGQGITQDTIFEDLAPGTYTLTVRDANQCLLTEQIAIGASVAVDAESSNLVDASCDLDDGQFLIIVNSGVAPFSFDLGNGPQHSPFFENLAAGNYTVTVTDDRACSTTVEVLIEQLGSPAISIIAQSDATCQQMNGSITVAGSGGMFPYVYDIGNGFQASPQFDGLVAGDYTITITDANICTATISTTLLSIDDLVDAEISLVNDANCGIANGLIAVEVTAGSFPYTYDIGNGPQTSNVFNGLAAGNYTILITDNQGCTLSLDASLGQTGSPQLSINNQVNADCQQANGSIEIVANSGVAPYTFDIGNSPQTNSQFNNLAASDYTVVVSDATDCSASISFTIIEEGDLPSASFTYTLIDGLATFTNMSLFGDSFFWDFGDGNTSTLINPDHLYELTEEYEVCLSATNACGVDTYCELISIEIPLVIPTIGGTIAKENGQTVALTEVSASNNPSQTTELDGQYLFEDQVLGSDLTIVPEKDINYINGCSTFDIFLINQHVLEVEFLDSPYKLIAADIDRNGHISTLDLVRLQQLILFNVDTFPNNTSWRFVPSDFVFTDPSDPFQDDFPEEITLNNIDSDQLDNDFVAIKIGDVNLSSNPASITTPEQESTFKIEKVNEENGFLTLAVRPSLVSTISALEFSLDINQNSLEFLEVLPNSENPPAYFYDKKSGQIHFSWYDQKGYGIASEELVFYLKFKTKNTGWQNAIRLSKNTSAKIYNPFGVDHQIHLQIENKETSATKAFPNPFKEQTAITFQLAKAQYMPIFIMDINGQFILEKEQYFDKGNNELLLNLQGYPAGIYFYQLGQYRGRLVKWE